MKKIAILLLWLWMSPSAWGQVADTVLINGKIVTVDQQFSIQEAIAVRDAGFSALAKLRKFKSSPGLVQE